MSDRAVGGQTPALFTGILRESPELIYGGLYRGSDGFTVGYVTDAQFARAVGLGPNGRCRGVELVAVGISDPDDDGGIF